MGGCTGFTRSKNGKICIGDRPKCCASCGEDEKEGLLEDVDRVYLVEGEMEQTMR